MLLHLQNIPSSYILQMPALPLLDWAENYNPSMNYNYKQDQQCQQSDPLLLRKTLLSMMQGIHL